jgi:hypothetical protein
MSGVQEIEIVTGDGAIIVETAAGVAVEIATGVQVVELGGVPGPQGPPGDAGDLGTVVDGGNF